jgi:uncharacterized protein (TIGR02594 family)
MLPEKYQWLLNEPGPKMLVEALKLYGTKEVPGNNDNPEILSWAAETGLSRVYSADAIPWCGLFIAIVAKRADKTFPDNPLWALNWAKFGAHKPHPELGDVLTFKRNGGGHVGLYVGEDNDCWHVLGGNQGDAVNIKRFTKDRLYECRSPIWKIAKPGNIRKVYLQPDGEVSDNEA